AFCSVENPLFASFRDHCRRIYGQDYYMLSGFMGDVGSGGGLIAPEMGAGVEPALEEFVLQKRTSRDYRPDASLADTISAFCERMHDEIRERGYPGSPISTCSRSGWKWRCGCAAGSTAETSSMRRMPIRASCRGGTGRSRASAWARCATAR